MTLTVLACLAGIGILGWTYWRYVFFFRNPPRTPPPGETVLSPADGRVVYARQVSSPDEVLIIKQGVTASIGDILRRDVKGDLLHIGIFMSPFDVHYNRAPIAGRIETIHHYPPRTVNRFMSAMHRRILFRRFPLYRNSPHIIENERMVTRISGVFRNHPVCCHVVQIAGGSVNGIDSYCPENSPVERGAIFGMIRIGSQVDMILDRAGEMTLKVRPGDRVRAGETILIA